MLRLENDHDPSVGDYADTSPTSLGRSATEWRAPSNDTEPK
jgi:hypothetical protein